MRGDPRPPRHPRQGRQPLHRVDHHAMRKLRHAGRPQIASARVPARAVPRRASSPRCRAGRRRRAAEGRPGRRGACRLASRSGAGRSRIVRSTDHERDEQDQAPHGVVEKRVERRRAVEVAAPRPASACRSIRSTSTSQRPGGGRGEPAMSPGRHGSCAQAQPSEIAVSPPEIPNRIGFRQVTGPSHGPPGTAQTGRCRSPLATMSDPDAEQRPRRGGRAAREPIAEVAGNEPCRWKCSRRSVDTRGHEDAHFRTDGLAGFRNRLRRLGHRRRPVGRRRRGRIDGGAPRGPRQRHQLLRHRRRLRRRPVRAAHRPAAPRTDASPSTWPRRRAAGCPPRRRPATSRENLTAFIDRSLTNLDVETLDLVQLHCPPTEVYYRPEVFGVLDDLVAAGKIRFYGVSVEKVEEALKAIEYPNVQSVQIIFNAFRLRPAELFFEQAHAAAGGRDRPRAAGQRPALGEVFTAEHRFQPTTIEPSIATAPTSTRARRSQASITKRASPPSSGCKPFVPPACTLAQFALQWILAFDAVTCVIPGAEAARPGGRQRAGAADLPPLDAGHDGRRAGDLRRVHPPARAPPVVMTGPTDILVIGAGAAGLFAATWAGPDGRGGRQAAVDRGRRRRPETRREDPRGRRRPLQRHALAGDRGRLRRQHAAGDPQGARAGSPCDDTVRFFAAAGVELKREDTGKLFPVTDSARTVLDALVREADARRRDARASGAGRRRSIAPATASSARPTRARSAPPA